MRFKSLVLLLSLLTLSAAASAQSKNIYGLNEYVHISDLDLTLAAKLDTGAQTASLSAKDIQRFERDGETWVRFTLAADGAPEQQIERPLARISKIKRRAADYDEDDGKSYTPRPVINLELCMGQQMRSIEVNLTDRSTFQYPLLIGSDALTQFAALVDPSLTYTVSEPNCTTDATPGE